MISRRQLLLGLVCLPAVARARTAVLKSPRALTWLFLGDSVTAAPESYAVLFQRKLPKLGRPRDVVVNAAQSGGGAFEARTALEAHLKAKPDVISIMVGLNDCLAGPSPEGMKTYKYNLKLALSLASGQFVVLHTPTPVDLKKHPQRKAVAKYAQFVRDLARVSGVSLVDHWPFWAAHHGVQHWLADGLHPNSRGQRALADRFVAALK